MGSIAFTAASPAAQAAAAAATLAQNLHNGEDQISPFGSVDRVEFKLVLQLEDQSRGLQKVLDFRPDREESIVNARIVGDGRSRVVGNLPVTVTGDADVPSLVEVFADAPFDAKIIAGSLDPTGPRVGPSAVGPPTSARLSFPS